MSTHGKLARLAPCLMLVYTVVTFASVRVIVVVLMVQCRPVLTVRVVLMGL